MIFRLKEKQTQFHTLNSDECILWQSKRKDESRGKKYHFPGRCRNEKKEPNRLDYRTDFRDVSRLFLHHFAPSFLRKICDFCSIDNIFSIFGAKTDVQKATTLLSPLASLPCSVYHYELRWALSLHVNKNSSTPGFSRVKLSQVINIQNGFCSSKCEIYASSNERVNGRRRKNEKR